MASSVVLGLVLILVMLSLDLLVSLVGRFLARKKSRKVLIELQVDGFLILFHISCCLIFTGYVIIDLLF